MTAAKPVTNSAAPTGVQVHSRTAEAPRRAGAGDVGSGQPGDVGEVIRHQLQITRAEERQSTGHENDRHCEQHRNVKHAAGDAAGSATLLTSLPPDRAVGPLRCTIGS